MAMRAKVGKKAGTKARSDCPVACSLDLIGDRWTLLVVRDLFFGKRRFAEFMASREGIKTNILAERLKRLERGGLIERVPYQNRPPRFEYRLTKPGRDLAPVIEAMATWGAANLPGARGRSPPGGFPR